MSEDKFRVTMLGQRSGKSMEQMHFMFQKYAEDFFPKPIEITFVSDTKEVESLRKKLDVANESIDSLRKELVNGVAEHIVSELQTGKYGAPSTEILKFDVSKYVKIEDLD